MSLISRLLEIFGLRPRGRHIFRYRVGKRYRFADPIIVALTLSEHPEYLPRHLAEARAGDFEAIEICGRAASDAFGIEPTASVTLSDRVKLLLAFDIWKAALRQKHDAFCRLVAMHGCDVSELDPERFTALYFARRENEVRIADIERLGIRSANAQLPLAWFYATYDTIDEARSAYDKHVASIASARS